MTTVARNDCICLQLALLCQKTDDVWKIQISLTVCPLEKFQSFEFRQKMQCISGKEQSSRYVIFTISLALYENFSEVGFKSIWFVQPFIQITLFFSQELNRSLVVCVSDGTVHRTKKRGEKIRQRCPLRSSQVLKNISYVHTFTCSHVHTFP